MKQFFGFKGKNKIYMYIYFILMLLFYFGYIWMESHPFKPPINNVLTQKDVENYIQLQKWPLYFEYMFLTLFILTMIIYCFRRNIKIIIGFISVNIILFIGITLISYILYFTGSLNIGNLLDPLRIPMFLMGVLLIYMLCLRLLRKSSA